MTLSEPSKAFVLHWGEMGSRWGVNRSVAQIHALLYLTRKPMPMDEIVEILGIARSNASNSLKELQNWKLVRTAPVMGDRRDHFVADPDGLDMVKKIVEGRRQREILPTIDTLETLVADAKADPATSDEVAGRMAETLELLRHFDAWYKEMSALPSATQMRLLRMGAAIARFLPKSKDSGE